MNFTSALFESDLEEHGLDLDFLRLTPDNGTPSDARTVESAFFEDDQESETSSASSSLVFFPQDADSPLPYEKKSTSQDFRMFPVNHHSMMMPNPAFNSQQPTVVNNNELLFLPGQLPPALMFPPYKMMPMPTRPCMASSDQPGPVPDSAVPSSSSSVSSMEDDQTSGNSKFSAESENFENSECQDTTIDLPKEGNTFYLDDCYENGAPRFQICHTRFITNSSRVLEACGGGETSRFDTRLCRNCRSKMRKKAPTQCHVSFCTKMSNGYNRIFCVQHSKIIAPLVRCINHDTCGNQIQDSISRKFCSDCLRTEQSRTIKRRRSKTQQGQHSEDSTEEEDMPLAVELPDDISLDSSSSTSSSSSRAVNVQPRKKQRTG